MPTTALTNLWASFDTEPSTQKLINSAKTGEKLCEMVSMNVLISRYIKNPCPKHKQDNSLKIRVLIYVLLLASRFLDQKKRGKCRRNVHKEERDLINDCGSWVYEPRLYLFSFRRVKISVFINNFYPAEAQNFLLGFKQVQWYHGWRHEIKHSSGAIKKFTWNI